MNNCSEGPKLFRPLSGHLGNRFLTCNLIKNEASSSAVLPSGSVFKDLGPFGHFWSVLSLFFGKKSVFFRKLLLSVKILNI